MLAELALRARSFSARSARKKKSSGDSSRTMSVGRRQRWGVGASESVTGGDGSLPMGPLSGTAGESSALARKLGIGRDDGAGDAWKVAPAKAGAIALGANIVCGGVVRPCFAGPGDVTCFARSLTPFRGLLGLGWLGCVAGAGLFEADFCGVAGLASSIGKRGSVVPMSFSEAYILRAGELTGLFTRRRAGVLFWGGNCGCSISTSMKAA